MADILTIDTQEASKKLSVLNKNFMLVIVILFAVSIMYLYKQQQELSTQLVNYLLNDQKTNTRIIEQNTEALKNIGNLINNNNENDNLNNISTSKKKLDTLNKMALYFKNYQNEY